MKKFLALMIMVCMMLTAVAFGEEAQAPVVVAANICDAQGNVIAAVDADGSLVLTDVNDRSAADAAIAERLNAAYENVMKDVHFSDVACSLHDHAVKVDINEALANNAQQLDAYDLVMTGLFDVAISDEVAAQLTDGKVLELTLEVQDSALPMMGLFTANGVAWKVIPVEAVGDKSFTVQLTESGAVAALANGCKTLSIGEELIRVEEIIPGEEGGEYELGFTNFTPSVSGKPAPEVIRVEGTDDVIYVGYIRNTTGDVDIQVPDQNYIIITPVSEREIVADVQTQEHLEWAYDGILKAEAVGYLPAANQDGTISADLAAALQKMGIDMNDTQLVVRDLFEVSAYGDYLEPLYNEDHYLELIFDTNLDPAEALIVAYSADSKTWVINPEETVQVNADGTVTLKLYDLGAVAFIVEAEAYMNVEDAVQSPN